MSDIYEELKKLNLLEELDLYKGIFWIVDTDNLEANNDYCFQIPCDSFGNVLDNGLNLNAKNGMTYNHKLVWKELPSSFTHNKPFNYYPRGRVELSNGNVRIYLNQNIATEEVKQYLIKQFNLLQHNGIKKVSLNVDGNEHYKCYLDSGWKPLK